jgi:hypothetical protein
MVGARSVLTGTRFPSAVAVGADIEMGAFASDLAVSFASLAPIVAASGGVSPPVDRDAHSARRPTRDPRCVRRDRMRSVDQSGAPRAGVRG